MMQLLLIILRLLMKFSNVTKQQPLGLKNEPKAGVSKIAFP